MLGLNVLSFCEFFASWTQPFLGSNMQVATEANKVDTSTQFERQVGPKRPRAGAPGECIQGTHQKHACFDF